MSQQLPAAVWTGNVHRAQIWRGSLYVLSDTELRCGSPAGPLGLLAGHPSKRAKVDGPVGVSKLRWPRSFCVRDSTGEVVVLERDCLRVIGPDCYTSSMKLPPLLDAVAICTPKDDHYCILSAHGVYIVCDGQQGQRNFMTVSFEHSCIANPWSMCVWDTDTVVVGCSTGVWTLDWKTADARSWLCYQEVATPHVVASHHRLYVIMDGQLKCASLDNLRLHSGTVDIGYDITNRLLQFQPSDDNSACLIMSAGDYSTVHVVAGFDDAVRIVVHSRYVESQIFFASRRVLTAQSNVFFRLFENGVDIPDGIELGYAVVTIDDRMCQGTNCVSLFEVILNFIEYGGVLSEHDLRTANLRPDYLIAGADFLEIPLLREQALLLLRAWMSSAPVIEYFDFAWFADEYLCAASREHVYNICQPYADAASKQTCDYLKSMLVEGNPVEELIESADNYGTDV